MPSPYTDVALARHPTLTAGQVDTVTFSTNYGYAEVKNRASSGAGISFRVDGTNPTVLGDDTYIVMPGESLIVKLGGSTDTVKLISATADAYSVTGVA